MKYPWIQFFATDWLNDPQVSICEPVTRGILMDWLCNMHLLDRCGQITGTREQLARLGRCTPVQVDACLQDLITTKAADVTFRNDVVTVINRRMKREFISRKQSALRVKAHRSNVACNGHVTPHSHKSESESEGKSARARPESPPRKRENWQLLKDEQALTDRIKKEAEACKPDAGLIAALKGQRQKIRDEMKR